MTLVDDTALYKRLIKQDPRAFQELVDQYKNLVYGVIRQTIPETTQAEDLAQEVFIRVYKGLPGFKGQSRLSSWIWRIAYRVCLTEIEQIRKEKGLVSIDNPDTSTNLRIHPDVVDEKSTWERMEDRDQWEVLFEQLPARHRMILVLYYYRNLSYLEIAEILDRPMGTVKSDLHRAKAALRKAYLANKQEPNDL
jgi:RNA polymerase sigma-70 factor (ECF subfamily)